MKLSSELIITAVAIPLVSGLIATVWAMLKRQINTQNEQILHITAENKSTHTDLYNRINIDFPKWYVSRELWDADKKSQQNTINALYKDIEEIKISITSLTKSVNEMSVAIGRLSEKFELERKY